MTRILSEYHVRRLDNDRFVQMTAPFRFKSDELEKAGFSPYVEIPVGFVQDEESVPLIRGRNKRGGGVHDYYSRHDSVPVVTKALAAEIYFELNAYCDLIDHNRNALIKAKDWLRRWSKYAVVYVWPGYFHRWSVFATPQEIIGIDGDPYLTIEEKIEAIIEKSEKLEDAIKAVPIPEAPALLKESQETTEALKEVKEKL